MDMNNGIIMWKIMVDGKWKESERERERDDLCWQEVDVEGKFLAPNAFTTSEPDLWDNPGHNGRIEVL